MLAWIVSQISGNQIKDPRYADLSADILNANYALS